MNEKDLFDACEDGNATVVELILRDHPDFLNCRDLYGVTPLICAARRGHENVVRSLLCLGGKRLETFATDDSEPGKTALDYASTDSMRNLLKLESHERQAELSLQAEKEKARIDAVEEAKRVATEKAKLITLELEKEKARIDAVEEAKRVATEKAKLITLELEKEKARADAAEEAKRVATEKARLTALELEKEKARADAAEEAGRHRRLEASRAATSRLQKRRVMNAVQAQLALKLERQKAQLEALELGKEEPSSIEAVKVKTVAAEKARLEAPELESEKTLLEMAGLEELEKSWFEAVEKAQLEEVGLELEIYLTFLLYFMYCDEFEKAKRNRNVKFAWGLKKKLDMLVRGNPMLLADDALLELVEKVSELKQRLMLIFDSVFECEHVDSDRAEAVGKSIDILVQFEKHYKNRAGTCPKPVEVQTNEIKAFDGIHSVPEFVCDRIKVADIQPFKLVGSIPSSNLFTGVVTFANYSERVFIKKASTALLRKELENEAKVYIALNRSQNNCCITMREYNSVNAYMVLPLFGTNLCWYMKPNCLIRQALLSQLSGALAALHNALYVHCDLKPENILVKDEGGGAYSVKICDFDSANMVGELFVHDSKTLALKYTPEWVSPEVYYGRGGVLKVAQSMDVFNFGLIAAALLAPDSTPSKTILPSPSKSKPVIEECFGNTLVLKRCLGIESLTYKELIYSMCQLDPCERPSLRTIAPKFAMTSTDYINNNAAINRYNVILEQNVKNELCTISSKLDNMNAVMIKTFDNLSEKVSLSVQKDLGVILREQNYQSLSQIESLLGNIQDSLTSSLVLRSDINVLRKELLLCMEVSQDSASSTMRAIGDDIRNEVTKVIDTCIANGAGVADVNVLVGEIVASSANIQNTVKNLRKDIVSFHAETKLLGAATVRAIQTSNTNIESVLASLKQSNIECELMLKTLINDSHGIPTLVVMLPHGKRGLERLNPKSWGTESVRICFICSHTLELVVCGKDGEGYIVQYTKEWVKKAIPVLSAGLVVLQLGLVATGLPVPLTKLSYSSKDRDEYMEVARSLIRDQMATTDTNQMSSNVDDFMGHLNIDMEASRNAYVTLNNILSQTDARFMQHSNMVKQTVDGKTAWIKDDPDIIASYIKNKGERMPSANTFQEMRHHYLKQEPTGKPENKFFNFSRK